MDKCVILINLRLGSFAAWQLEHVPRSSNEKADALAIIVASLLVKETMLLPCDAPIFGGPIDKPLTYEISALGHCTSKSRYRAGTNYS